MVGKRRKALLAKGVLKNPKAEAAREASKAKKAQKSLSARAGKEDRRAKKLERRKKEKKSYTAQDWAEPAPDHLIAKLDLPKHSSKYQSYFEFAENTEKKKKLEFQVTNDPHPPPGFTYVPIGDPTLTNACKELSREQNAMIFIVSRSKEDNSKISEHVFRTGYHFREVIVDEARKAVGDTVISNTTHGLIEPIPESQDEINKQADAAIRDLFPRIPNTDRQRIIEHAFQKGVKFHGEPTVGLQADLPLARRVQLAVLAHIRHTHTRYDKLLKETSWINARKVVEPVCLDVLVKWRGDEETGRDQMDEILREVVIITDSDDEDDESDEDDDSDESSEEGETSIGSAALALQDGPQRRQPLMAEQDSYANVAGPSDSISSHTRSRARQNEGLRKPQPRFKRYQAAWDEAVNRGQNNVLESNGRSIQGYEASMRPTQPNDAPKYQEMPRRQAPIAASRPHTELEYIYRDTEPRHSVPPEQQIHHYYQQERAPSRTLLRRNEVTVRPLHDRPAFQPPQFDTAPQVSRVPRSQGVVRASPNRSGFQDLLALSIETQNDSINVSPRLDRGTVRDLGHHQESYPRHVVEGSRLTPRPREVILIDDDDDNDDSPYSKRRRVIEDDHGRFRPYPSRVQNVQIAPNFSYGDADRRSVALPRYTEGLSQHLPLASSRPILSERVPIYDAPDSRPYEMHSSLSRREDERLSYQQPVSYSRREIAARRPYLTNSDETYNPQRVANDSMRVANRDQFVRREQVEPGQRYYLQRPASPDMHDPRRISHPQIVDGPADQAFIQRFSQSGLESPLSRPQDGPVSYQRFAPNIHRQGESLDQAARSFTVMRPVQSRSPVRYLDRVERSGDRSGPPVYYERRDPYTIERHISNTMRVSVPPDPHYQTNPRVMHPGRQVIVLD
ncbi:uncharacterized protein EAE98_008122 [Botrytis deweyae]|uniref:DUF2293 domain-containing protein n=1 Tax=Botrytis deweyae TaxID=2478750 RepID=A0ABQ7IG22_9HELO|nr:uncharacterized protein EAE98_008122 [Botrytis deweyae]KAF7922596.1 hypothetical protein EAE98_008122 [Botrytis deweyae]